MSSSIKVGDKVIGLTSWYSEPHIGTVLLVTENFDPLHDLLINESNQAITVSNTADFRSRLQELSGLTQLISSQKTLLYSPQVEARFNRLYRFLNSKHGKKASNYELEMKGFFKRGWGPFLLRTRAYFKLCISFLIRHGMPFG